MADGAVAASSVAGPCLPPASPDAPDDGGAPASRSPTIRPSAAACRFPGRPTRSREAVASAASPCATDAIPGLRMASTIRASGYAVAVIACAPPRRAALRRQHAPQALGRRCRVCAARRHACAARGRPGRGARDVPRPPDCCGGGARPSQLPPGVARGPRRLAVPTARRTTSAGRASIPSRAVTAPPATGCRRGRASQVPAVSGRRRPRRVGSRGGTAGNAMPWRGAASTRAPSWLGSWSSSDNAREGGRANTGSGCHIPCSARARVATLAVPRGSRRRAHAGGARSPRPRARRRRLPVRPVRALPPAGSCPCRCSSACSLRCRGRPAAALRRARCRCDARPTRLGSAGRPAAVSSPRRGSRGSPGRRDQWSDRGGRR